ncbi:MAG: hypothetical protein AB1397_07655 [bacterium]
MFRKKAIKGLICLLAMGVMACASLAMAKKPAQEPAQIEKPQAVAQPEAKSAKVKKTTKVSRIESESTKGETIEQKGTQTTETEAIEPEPIMEYKLPEGEEIVDVIFGEATMTVKEARALGMKGLEKRKATEKVKVQYPKVVITQEKPWMKIIEGVKTSGAGSLKSIKFLDKKGDVFKTIPLEEVKIVEITKKAPLEKQKPYKIKYLTLKYPAINKNAKLIGLGINEKYGPKINEEGKEEFYEGCGEQIEKGKVLILDSNGNVLWEKEFPKGRGAEPPLISDNGEIIVVETGYMDIPMELFSLPELDTTEDRLYIYDKNGNEILRIPSGKEKEYLRLDSMPMLSQNGRYLSVKIENKLKKYPDNCSTFFYDLKRKTYWDAEKEYWVYEISNDGIVEVKEFGKGKPIVKVDLKKYLGE